MLRHKSKGQSILEYALVISVVVAALLAIAVYMQRGMHGRLKESSNEIGKQFDPTQDYVNAYRSASSGTSITDETKDLTTGKTTSSTTTAETITSAEDEQWGTAPTIPTMP